VSFLTLVPAGRSVGTGTGRKRLLSAWTKKGYSGLGRGDSAFSVASEALVGVTHPGNPWWAWSLTSSLSLAGLDCGRRDLGSSTAAGPSP
jgi:hypothetical protein